MYSPSLSAIDDDLDDPLISLVTKEEKEKGEEEGFPLRRSAVSATRERMHALFSLPEGWSK